jgi:hypothetical protein
MIASLLVAMSLALSSACGGGGGQVGAPASDCGAPGADCTLRQAAEEAGVLIGSAVRDVFDADARYGPALARDFSSLTAETAMKWDSTEPARGVFDFAAADRLVEFADVNGMAVRGHALIWEQAIVDSTPDYVTVISDAGELRALMADHIRTVVGRYRGRIDSWDVVNEPLETAGSRLYENTFYRLLGPGYIAEAFALAHEADPDAKLFLNEPLVESAGEKFDALLELVANLRAQGVPVHGVGLQGHFFAEPEDGRAPCEPAGSRRPGCARRAHGNRHSASARRRHGAAARATTAGLLRCRPAPVFRSRPAGVSRFGASRTATPGSTTSSGPASSHYRSTRTTAGSRLTSGSATP